MTKLGGMRHVYHSYTHYLGRGSGDLAGGNPALQADVERIVHARSLDESRRLAAGRDHRSNLEELRAGRVSCGSDGCQGPSHPFSKVNRPSRAEGVR